MPLTFEFQCLMRLCASINPKASASGRGIGGSQVLGNDAFGQDTFPNKAGNGRFPCPVAEIATSDQIAWFGCEEQVTIAQSLLLDVSALL